MTQKDTDSLAGARQAGKGVLRTLVSLAALVAMAVAQTSGASEGQLKELTLEQLGDLEVTTKGKAPEQIWKTAAAIFVITQDDIRRSGATSLPEALRLAPGVEVARINGNQWSIGIRGFGSRLARSVLVLIDGRSVYTTLLAGTYWEVQDTLLEDVERIEVIRGPGGTVWGPNAVNGVINIITKSSKDTQGWLVATGAGNEEQGFLKARYGGTNSHGLSYRIYGKAFDRGPQFHADGTNYDRWRAAQSGFRMDWSSNQRDAFTVQGDLYSQTAGENVHLDTYNPPSSQIVTGNAFLSGGNVLARWTRTYHEGNDVQVQVYYDRTNRHEPNFGDIRNTADVDLLHRFYLGPRNHISWGLGTRASHGDEIEVAHGIFFSPSSRTDQLYSAFLEDDIALVPNRLTLEIGTKILHTNFAGVEAQPSGRLLWTRTPTESLWLAATRAVRTPSEGEHDFNLSSFLGNVNGLPFFARFIANPDFKPEKVESYELGFRKLLAPNFYLSTSGFFNEYHDLFSQEIIGPSFVEDDPAPTHLLIPAQFRNGLYGTTAGGEIAPEWRPAGFWRLRGSYSFLRMSLKKKADSMDIGSAPFVESQSPRHQVMVQSGFDLTRHLNLDLSYRFVSALPKFSVPSYSTGDVRAAWTFSHNWEISAVGRNLLQPSHVEFPSDPGPNVGIERSFYLQLLWRSKAD